MTLTFFVENSIWDKIIQFLNVCCYNEEMIDSDIIMNLYKKEVTNKHPKLVFNWPLFSGYNVISGNFSYYKIFVFIETNNPDRLFCDIKSFNSLETGEKIIKKDNLEKVRANLYKNLHLNAGSYVMLLHKDYKNLNDEIIKMLNYHELVVGIKNRKIFLSEIGNDNKSALEYKILLDTMGFETWMYENDLSFIAGLDSSCAAVFLISKNIDDIEFTKQIQFVLNQKNKADRNFSIIALSNDETDIPKALKPYFIKTSNSVVENLMQIIKALPKSVLEYSYYCA